MECAGEEPVEIQGTDAAGCIQVPAPLQQDAVLQEIECLQIPASDALDFFVPELLNLRKFRVVLISLIDLPCLTRIGYQKC